ncbi:MAG TPA: GNAT family N-acetyltransferase [Bacillales bacterium]|nr:GNAT family N-acetyltransferase [Bacillales bacterium]
MIRQLTEKDNERVMAFLSDEAAFNLFTIGDIENFGYGSDFQDIWADFDKAGDMRAVLLRYYDSYLPYAKGEFDTSSFTRLIKDRTDLKVVQGKADVMDRFRFHEFAGFPLMGKRSMYFAELKKSDRLDGSDDSNKVKKARVEDVDGLLKLHNQIEEFSAIPPDRERLVHKMESKSGRTVIIEERGEIVASASTTAENTYSAMVVGVMTKPGCRRKGYASICMSALCREVLEEEKTLCLFYDNPEAGNIYKRLGFHDIGMWDMYLKES